MSIPPLPIDFASLASQGVSVLGSIAVAVAGVIVLGCLIFMGFKWIRMAFSADATATEERTEEWWASQGELEDWLWYKKLNGDSSGWDAYQAEMNRDDDMGAGNWSLN